MTKPRKHETLDLQVSNLAYGNKGQEELRRSAPGRNTGALPGTAPAGVPALWQLRRLSLAVPGILGSAQIQGTTGAGITGEAGRTGRLQATTHPGHGRSLAVPKQGGVLDW